MATRNSSDSRTPLRAASSLKSARIIGVSLAWMGESSAGYVCPTGRPIFGLSVFVFCGFAMMLGIFVNLLEVVKPYT